MSLYSIINKGKFRKIHRRFGKLFGNSTVKVWLGGGCILLLGFFLAADFARISKILRITGVLLMSYAVAVGVGFLVMTGLAFFIDRYDRNRFGAYSGLVICWLGALLVAGFLISVLSLLWAV